jgi:putative peptide zinc metalloprotease protein
VTTLVDAPARVDGVQLIGDMVGSGYRSPPALVRRADGQVLQLTPLVYLVLQAADGRRGCAEIAEQITPRLGRGVTESDVRTLVDSHLRPLGLVTFADGSAPELKRSNPLLSLKPRVAITNPRTTRRLTDPFRVLFRPVVAAAVVAGFVAVVTWVFFDRGLGASAYDAFERPHLLLLVFVVSVLSGGFHEFGHAAAARYSGAKPGAMGAGVYLVWPAFYTDVTDSYRLGRGGRIRTDLGGLYFNAIVVVLTFGWWWATGWEALLLLVATQVMQMVQQVQPLLRFDGYHVLADLAGVPDLYHRIKPTLLGLLPHRWKAPENRMLTPWARSVITLWVLVTVPMMALMLLALIRAVPRLLGSAGSVLRKDAASLSDAWSAGSLLDIAAQVLQMLGVVLPLMAGALILGRLGFRFFRGLALWSEDSTPKRIAAAVLTFAVITGLSWAWWPDPFTYRPIQPGERGLVTSVVQLQETAHTEGAAGTAAQTRLSSSRPLVAAFPEGQALPTEDDPVLALVLVPTDGEPDDTWVLPFDKPLPPAEGDNQALAVNTTDGSVTYDLAFAMVWAEGDEVLNVNEAHAYASCSDCVAVAVAFQVVLIMDDAHVVVPQNLAVAANYDCYQCITAAIASQLVLSVDGEPGEEELRSLGEVWGRLIQFAGRITSYTLTEITAQLDSFKGEIVGILEEAPMVEPAPSPSTTDPASPSLSPTTTGPPSTIEQYPTDPPPQAEPSTTDPAPQTEQSSTGSSSTAAESTPPPAATEGSPSPPDSPSP